MRKTSEEKISWEKKDTDGSRTKLEQFEVPIMQFPLDIPLSNVYMDLDHFSRVFPVEVFTFLS